MKRLHIIQITEQGSDCAVILDQKTVLTADPQRGESTEPVYTAATRLADILKTSPATVIEFPAQENWTWEGVLSDLKDTGRI